VFAKLAVTILALGACGCAVLAARQSRLQAAHELAQTQLRIRLLDERLFRLRTEIGYLVRPENVQGMVAGLGPLKPITPTPTAPISAPATTIAPDALTESGVVPRTGRPAGSRDGKKSRSDGASRRADADDAGGAAVDGDVDENRYAAQDVPEDER
jgi:hypothetical protein